MFDAVKVTVKQGSGPDELASSDAFRHGLAYLDNGFYWEAHEVLEPVWMALEDGSTERRLVQALIQTANAHLKSEMGWPKAALRLIAIAEGLVPECGACMGVDIDLMRAKLIDLKYKMCKIMQ